LNTYEVRMRIAFIAFSSPLAYDYKHTAEKDAAGQSLIP